MTRIQFSRWYLVPAVVVTAVLLLLGLTVGWEMALAVLTITLMACTGGWSLRRRHFAVGRFVLSILSLTVLWMLFVDFSWFVESCQDCHLYQDVFQYRILGVPIHEMIRPGGATVARIAEDLGHPCSHRFQRWHKTRWWGLLVRGWPNINGITRLCGFERDDGVDTWYDDRAAAIVRAAAKASPGLGDEFFRRACLDQDWCYRRKFTDAIRAKRVAEPDPPVDLVSGINSVPKDSALAAATALKTTDFIVVPDPARRPLTIFDSAPADVHVTCPKCKEPVTVKVFDFLLSNIDWEQHVSAYDAGKIAQMLALPRQTEWYGEDRASHGGGNAVVGVQDCPKCGCRCLVYLSCRLVGRGRYSVTLQGLARLPTR